MNTRTTLFVLLIAVSLGLYFIMSQRAASPDEQSTHLVQSSGNPIFDADSLRPADVRTLILTISGKPPMALQRDAADSAKWSQTSPIRIAVNEWTINDLIDNVSLLRYSNTMDPHNLPDYGLSPAKVTLTLTGATPDGKSFTHTLKFGRTTAAGQGLLMLDDEPRIYAVDATLHRQLIGIDPMSLRSTTLAEIPLSKVTKLSLKREGLDVTVAQDSGRWHFAAGATGRVDTVAVASLLNAINYAVIEKFAADNPTDLARYGLADPKLTLAVEVRPDDPGDSDAETKPQPITHTLRIGNPEDLSQTKFFATYDPDAAGTVFVITSQSADQLNISIDDLRDPRLTPAAAEDIREIIIDQSGGTKLHFLREEGRWTFADPKPTFAIEPTAVTQLLDSLLKAHAVEFVTPSKTQPPLAVITLAVAQQPQNETFTVTQHAENQLLIQRTGEDLGYVINSPDLAMVFEPTTAYRDHTVWDLQRDNILSLKLQRTGDYPATYELSRSADGQWDLTQFDSAAIDQLLAAITPLRATRWLDQSPLDIDLNLTVTLADSSTRTLKAATNLKTAATDEGPFELELATVVALMTELRNRKLIDVEYDQIARVQRSDLIIDCDPNLLYSIQGDPMFDESMAAQIFDTLAALHAEHFVPDDWAKIDPDNPSFTLQITRRDNLTTTLKLWSPQSTPRNQPLGKIDSGPLFTLSPFTYQILSGNYPTQPLDPDDPLK